MVNVTALNETLWLSEYDSDNFTKEMVVANLTARGIYAAFENWYETYFGSNGIVVLAKMQANQTSNATGNATEDSSRTLQAAIS